MSTPILTVTGLAAVTLFMIVSLVTADGRSIALQRPLAAVAVAAR